jgi:hypothetical protein
MVQFYCTGAKQQQKKKMGKKTKKRKKSQFEDGTICSLEFPDPFRSIGSYFLCIVFVLCSQGEFLGPFL